jgi:hypothetical protein
MVVATHRYTSMTIAAPKEFLMNTAVIIVRIPAATKAYPPKRFDFLHVLSLYMLHVIRTPAILLFLVFGMKFPAAVYLTAL